MEKSPPKDLTEVLSPPLYIENWFTAQAYRKLFYSTGVQRTSLQCKCSKFKCRILHMIRNIQGQTLHNNLCCTLIKYHTDRKLHSTGNVQGQTHIKINFNFVQGHSDTHSLTHSDKATLWIIELLTSQLKNDEAFHQLYMLELKTKIGAVLSGTKHKKS